MKENHILVVSTLLLQILTVSTAAKVGRTGGYGIVVALQDTTPQPNNPHLYLDNIKDVLQKFSNNLYTSTKRKFFIDTVDMIVPNSWKEISFVGASSTTWQSYRTADIRIDNVNDSPRVDNPNACGTSGNFIQLPVKFFDEPVYGNYGSPGKALLNLWARYRFGVWEEHGYPDDVQFPYVYQKPSLNPVWRATGCSNKELDGKFINRHGGNCTTDDNGKPEEECKFSPSLSNTAVSSLLHFHWLNSVTEFCDLRTHNYAAPNRQNFLCGHKSVWDIIKETADFKIANGRPVETVPRLQFNIWTESQKPLFYLLIDNGRSSYPLEIVREIMTTLGTVYDDMKNVASLGSFPNPNPRSNAYVAENVPWTPIFISEYDFLDALDDLISNDGAVVRDFGAAILEVLEQIKLRNHKAGAVIMVVKRGVGENTFDRLAYEQEIIATLHEQTNIKLFAIEFQENEKTAHANLNYITNITEGEHLLITGKINTGRKLAPILLTAKELLQDPITSSRKFQTVTKQFLGANESFEVPVFENGFQRLELHLTTSSSVKTPDIELKQVAGKETIFHISERKEWDENFDSSKRTVHTFTIEKPPKDSVWSIRYTCRSEDSKDCTGFLVVYGLKENPMESENDSVAVTVSTSADDGFVDMSRQGQGPKPVPFSVYAKVEKDGQPILNIKNVHALIRLSDNSKSWKIPLLDNGNGNPDVSFGDGVYSNVFIPIEDGFYRISILVRYNNNKDIHESQVSDIGRLLPVNQHQIGCYNSTDKSCIPADPSGSFLKVSDLPGRIAIENCATFRPGRPMKITDFQVTVLPNFRVIFSFTSPKLLGSNNSPQEFQIFMAPSPNNYLGSTDQTKLIVAQIGEKPGNRLQIPYYTLQTALPYYAVEAIYDNMRSGPSNIVGVNTGIPSGTTNTTQGTTITTITMTTTTQRPTSTTGESSTSITTAPSSAIITTSATIILLLLYCQHY